MVKSLNSELCRSLFGDGVNAGSTASGVQEIVRLLDQAKKITRDSVFVDFGCSVGGVCMYIAARFGCRVIGIEKDANTVELGRNFLQGERHLKKKRGRKRKNQLTEGDREGIKPSSVPVAVTKLCRFIVGDFTEVVDGDFLHQKGVTHVFAYDAVFSPEPWHKLFDMLAAGPPIVGVSCARKRGCKLPEGFVVLDKSTKPIGLTGSPSKFKVMSWQNFSDASNKAPD